MIEPNLQAIKSLIEQQEMDAEIVAPSSDIPVELLHVSLGPDEKGRDLIMQISLSAQDLSQNDEALGLTTNSSSYHLIRFFLPFPFDIREEALADLSRYILYLNNSFELPGLELVESYQMINYRYVLLHAGDQLDERVVLSLMGMMLSFVDAYSKNLEAIASGEKKFSDFLL